MIEHSRFAFVLVVRMRRGGLFPWFPLKHCFWSSLNDKLCSTASSSCRQSCLLKCTSKAQTFASVNVADIFWLHENVQNLTLSHRILYPFVRNAFLVALLPDFVSYKVVFWRAFMHVTKYVCKFMKTESTTCKDHFQFGQLARPAEDTPHILTFEFHSDDRVTLLFSHYQLGWKVLCHSGKAHTKRRGWDIWHNMKEKNQIKLNKLWVWHHP